MGKVKKKPKLNHTTIQNMTLRQRECVRIDSTPVTPSYGKKITKRDKPRRKNLILEEKNKNHNPSQLSIQNFTKTLYSIFLPNK